MKKQKTPFILLVLSLVYLGFLLSAASAAPPFWWLLFFIGWTLFYFRIFVFPVRTLWYTLAWFLLTSSILYLAVPRMRGYLTYHICGNRIFQSSTIPRSEQHPGSSTFKTCEADVTKEELQAMFLETISFTTK